MTASQVLALLWLASLQKKVFQIDHSIPDPANFKALEGRIQVMETTWEEVYSRLRKIAGRIDKSQAIEERKNTNDEPKDDNQARAQILRAFLTGKRAG